MLRCPLVSCKPILACALLLGAVLPVDDVRAAGFEIIYSFRGGSDGMGPYGGLYADAAGNLYGSTSGGGGNNGCGDNYGCGTVFKLAPDGTEAVLHAFGNADDGAAPFGNLIADKTGNLFGTTEGGGVYGAGTAFRVTPGGKEEILYAFTGGNDGGAPYAGLLLKDGVFYGTAIQGGTYGGGTVFMLTQKGSETVLHAFGSGHDGNGPRAGVIMDKAGNLYGTTVGGGAHGQGIVFELAPGGGAETVLHSFACCSDGSYPAASLIMDKTGNLYGTTVSGGDNGGDMGTVFKLASDGTETVLHSFVGGEDGNGPFAALIEDKAGNLYSTTEEGGGLGGNDCSGYGCGTVFAVTPAGTEKVLHAFAAGSDGSTPTGSLLELNGYLYGTTHLGGGTGCQGYGCGTIFRVKK